MDCPKCGFDNIESAKFCAKCGHALISPKSTKNNASREQTNQISSSENNKKIIIICISFLLCISVICGIIILTHESNTGNNATNITNTTNNSTGVQEQTSNSQTTEETSSSGGSDDDYHYSAQYGTYIKEWEDSNGSHMISKDGKWEEHYNEKTGILKERSPYTNGWKITQM